MRSNKQFKEVYLVDIKPILMAWLRNSCDREGGRKRRRESKLEKKDEYIAKIDKKMSKRDRLIEQLYNEKMDALQQLHDTQVQSVSAGCSSVISDVGETTADESSLAAENLCVRDKMQE